MKSRWPNLRSLDRPPPRGMDDHHMAVLRRVRSEVARRIHGADAWIDVWRRELVFGYPNGGDTLTAIGWPLFRGVGVPNRFDPALGEDSVDDVVRTLNYGRAPVARKNQWEQQRRRSHDQADAAIRERAVDQAVEQAADRTKHQYRTHTMGRHHRPFADLGA